MAASPTAILADKDSPKYQGRIEIDPTGQQIRIFSSRGDAMRYIAIGIEEALGQDRRGISMERRLAWDIRNALWDYADRLDWDA